jgi:DNA-binding MarR family transcriptional regulator
MSTFKKYKKIKSILSEFPGVKTYKEFDILIEIGYHQEQNNPLTLKQLLLLEVASQATVRRYLAHLLRDGMVERSVAADRRSFALKLSSRTIRMMTNHLARIIEHLSPMPTGKSPKSRSKGRKA